MPERTYMVVDPRRDHSIRIPRPDLTLKTGSPNACNRCHDDHTAQWSEDHVAEWYGAKRRRPAHFGETLHLARTGAAESTAALTRLAMNMSQPAVARATAVQELAIRPGPAALRTVDGALRDPDPNVRAAAALALQNYPPQERHRAFPLLADPVRQVRVSALEALAGIRITALDAEQRAALEKAALEYVRSELTNSDRAYAHTNIGSVLVRMGHFGQAERAYLKALEMTPGDVVATVNLADLYRLVERDDVGEKVLRTGLAANPGAGAIHHALGLLFARQRRVEEAIPFLEKSADLQPGIPRYGYTHAVALHSTGNVDGAIRALEKVHHRHGDDVEVIVALIRFNESAGKLASAVVYAEKLVQVRPEDPGARQLLEQLRRKQRQ
jgi:Flp pilus assembly protein TadD